MNVSWRSRVDSVTKGSCRDLERECLRVSWFMKDKSGEWYRVK